MTQIVTITGDFESLRQFISDAAAETLRALLEDEPAEHVEVSELDHSVTLTFPHSAGRRVAAVVSLSESYPDLLFTVRLCDGAVEGGEVREATYMAGDRVADWEIVKPYD